MLFTLETSLSRGLLGSCKLVSSGAQCCVQLQSVRHYPKKPRWVPIAKSRMYQIIEVAVPPKLEHEEFTAYRDTYELYNRSLWKFQGEISREKEMQRQREAKQVSEEVELERIMSINNAENEKVRKIREAALIEEWKEVEREILEIKRQKEEDELKELEQTEEYLKSEMERLKGAIKLEDLDEAIEKALAVEYDYNFAISKDGKFVRGRFNSSDTEAVEGPPPYEPIVKSMESSK